MYKDLNEILNHLAAAANHLRIAVSELREICKAQDPYLCNDAIFYIQQIDSLLSADNGAAGIDALIRRVQSKLNQEMK